MKEFFISRIKLKVYTLAEMESWFERKNPLDAISRGFLLPRIKTLFLILEVIVLP